MCHGRNKQSSSRLYHIPIIELTTIIVNDKMILMTTLSWFCVRGDSPYMFLRAHRARLILIKARSPKKPLMAGYAQALAHRNFHAKNNDDCRKYGR
jgi:hypothetical protein